MDVQRRLLYHGKPRHVQSPGRTCGLVGDTHWSRLQQNLTPQGTQAWSWRTACCGGSHARAVHDLQPVGRSIVGEVHGESSPVGCAPCWSRGGVWGVLPLRRKDQGKYDELTLIPLSCPSVPLSWEVGEKIVGVRLSPGTRREWEEGVWRFSFYFSLSCGYLIGNKLNYFSECVMVIEWSLLSLDWLMSLLLYLLSPVQMRRIESLLGTCHAVRVTPILSFRVYK